MVVSQFEIFAAVRQRASRLRFPERRPAVRPLFPRAKPSSSSPLAPRPHGAEAGCDRSGQLMQIALATVGEPATPPRQMRHGFQPTAQSPRGSRELALGLANPSGRRGAEPRIGDGFAGRQRRKPLHAPVNPDQVAGFLAPPRSGARRARRGLPW